MDASLGEQDKRNNKEWVKTKQDLQPEALLEKAIILANDTEVNIILGQTDRHAHRHAI